MNVQETLEILINVDAMANKWLMWCETNFRDQSVYIPSIFQIRDAQSHFIQMIAFGIQNNSFTNEEESLVHFFNHTQVLSQINEVLNHTFRAFYDCADYILVTIEDEINMQNGFFSRFDYITQMKIIREQIEDIRKAKSETAVKSFDNVEKYDLILQTATTLFLLSDLKSDVIVACQAVIDKIDRIENKFQREVIIDYYNDFYIRKQYFYDLKEEIDEYGKISDLSNHVLGDIIAYQNDMIAKLTEIHGELKKELALLQSKSYAMKTTQDKKDKDKLKGIPNIILAVISSICTAIISNLFNSQAYVETKKQLDLIFVIKFVVIFIILFFVLVGLYHFFKSLYYKCRK